MTKRSTITTAIDYPNAGPHMGHVLEKVLADACARWCRLRGDQVRFQTGTDEHGIKIQQTAAKAGLTPKQLVDQNVLLFESLYNQLNISYDDFLRTSDQARHWPTVKALWQKIAAAGDLEKRTYEGLYCSGCERFITDKDLIDGKCEIHLREPEKVAEQNWFFLLTKYQDWLKDLLTKEGGYKIVPEFRAPETLQLIEQGLEDVSFSRPKSSMTWGIPVPGEEETQTMYVWCDALTNYISTLGLLTDEKEAVWWNESEVTHVIGKDIARFHALIWPAMLKSGGLNVPPPHRLLIHGFLTSEGQKMSKSLGNVVVPADAIAKYGVDPLRFYLSHEIPVGNDGDFSWKRFGELYDSKLRNQLGNLLNRVLVLLGKSGGQLGVITKGDHADQVAAAWGEYRAAADAFEMHKAVAVAMGLVESLNLQMQTVQPWTKPVEEQREILTQFAEVLRHVALMFVPFMPETAQKITMQLGLPYAPTMLEKSFVLEGVSGWGALADWKAIGTPGILFPRIEEAPAKA